MTIFIARNKSTINPKIEVQPLGSIYHSRKMCFCCIAFLFPKKKAFLAIFRKPKFFAPLFLKKVERIVLITPTAESPTGDYCGDLLCNHELQTGLRKIA
jgi:hypothetical protein